MQSTLLGTFPLWLAEQVSCLLSTQHSRLSSTFGTRGWTSFSHLPLLSVQLTPALLGLLSPPPSSRVELRRLCWQAQGLTGKLHYEFLELFCV